MHVQNTPQGKMVIVTNALYKLAGYASVLLIADVLVPGLYSSLVPLFATVLVLTGVGVIADLVILPLLGNVLSLLIGAQGFVLILYVTPLLWPGSTVTLTRAIVLALCMAPLEFALHRYVLRWLFPDGS
ncbi:DUF2512 family protein [Alicyclobacillus pomorum]|jgi:hypothetical protein|uniref:DUF2512 family protein n=1 Tax=Alicyclobacillus pomorum TaxID=204470 RepID=UPI000410F24D|nr:DUF2512 family protein [Alicyclobacillus pomorum]